MATLTFFFTLGFGVTDGGDERLGRAESGGRAGEDHEEGGGGQSQKRQKKVRGTVELRYTTMMYYI